MNMNAHTDKGLRSLLSNYRHIQDNIGTYGMSMVENLCDIDRALQSTILNAEENLIIHIVYLNSESDVPYTIRVMDVAKQLDLSVATVYRRIDKAIEKLLDYVTFGERFTVKYHFDN